jgi:hypothetical protein
LQLNSASAVDIETGVSNSAGLSRFGTRGSGNSFVGAFTAGKSLELWSAGSQNATLDASGNLGIGTTAPSDSAGFGRTLDVAGASGAGAVVYVRANASATNYLALGQDTSGNSYILNRANASMLFYTNNTERARIDSSGNLLVGTTSLYKSGKVSVNAGGTNGITCQVNDVLNPAFQAWCATTTGNAFFIDFATESTFTSRGSISYDRGSGLVVYATTSDYRSKDIIGPVVNPGATIDALKVYEGQMKGATQSLPMLVAHEAQAITPYAVTGEKDAVNEDGTPKFQQMDVSSLVPLLIAEIQSLRQRVAQLEGA